MENVNKILATIFAIGALFCTGCESITPEVKFNLILSVIENGTTFSVKSFLDNNSENKEAIVGYLNDTASIIDEALTTGKIKPDVFKEYVTSKLTEKVPVPYNISIISLLDLAIGGYNKFYASNVKDKIENQEKAKQVIESIIAGIVSGTDPVSGDILGDKNPLEDFDDWEL